MSILTTATGKTYQCDYFNPSEQLKQLNLRVIDEPLAAVAAVFSHAYETEQLTCDGVYAAGYTRLIAIVPEGNAIRFVLGKE